MGYKIITDIKRVPIWKKEVMDIRGSFPGSRAAGAWSYTSSIPPISLRGVVLS